MNRFVLFVLVAALITSCSNSVESDAIHQMEKTMKELAKDPSSVQILDIKTMFADDSLCILHYRISAKNGFGAMRTSRYEYVYLVHKRFSNKELRSEIVIDLEDKNDNSILDDARKYYKEKLYETDSISSLKEKDRKAYYLHFAADVRVIFHGRAIGEDIYDIDDW